jgi:hypothetical protein
MRTLFLGSYGFGNLGDELCLIDALRRFPTNDAWAFSAAPQHTAKLTKFENFIQKREEVADIKPQRIVLGGGGVGFWPSLRDSLHWMHDALAWGAELHVYNIGIARIVEPEWFADPTARSVIAKLKTFSVRDHVSQWLTHEWKFGRLPSVEYYPEYTLPTEVFSHTPIGANAIGFSITSQPAMLDCLTRNRDTIARFVDGLGDIQAVPIVSTIHRKSDAENDIDGFKFFADMFLAGRSIAVPEMLDRGWWENELTPLRLKFIIGQLRLLVSQRKHNIIHALGTETPFVGLFPDVDDSILRIFYTMRHKVPAGSSIISLESGRYHPGGQK